MITKICKFCLKKFQVYDYRKKSAGFCCAKCYNSYRKENAYKKICPQCNKKFITHRPTRNRKYCNKTCSQNAQRKHDYKDKICKLCKKSFKFNPKNPNQIFCNHQCNVKSRAYKVDDTFFNKINTEGKAYFLGLMFSDGNISSKSNHINISSNDKNLIKTCKKLLKTNSPIHCYKNSFSLIISNSNLHRSLESLGVLKRKSWKELSVPTISSNLIRHFIRGVYDGDGSFYLDKRQNNKYIYLCTSLSCGSRQFTNQLKKILEHKLKISFHKIRFDDKKNETGSWQLRLSRQADVKKFTNYLYQNCNYYLKRKYNFIRNFYHE